AFDVVTCMELLEHVPDPGSMVAACARLVRPGGHVFFSTINRNPKSYLFAVVGAEYVLGLLPKGTHDYQRFVKPSELAAWSRAAGRRGAPLRLDGRTRPAARRLRPRSHRPGLPAAAQRLPRPLRRARLRRDAALSGDGRAAGRAGAAAHRLGNRHQQVVALHA